MEKPSRSRSASRGAKSDGGQGKGKDKGKGKSKNKAKDQIVHWCRDFLKEGGCRREKDCRFPRLSSDAVEACKIAATNAKKAS